jgi:hypothetical protein
MIGSQHLRGKRKNETAAPSSAAPRPPRPRRTGHLAHGHASKSAARCRVPPSRNQARCQGEGLWRSLKFRQAKASNVTSHDELCLPLEASQFLDRRLPRSEIQLRDGNGLSGTYRNCCWRENVRPDLSETLRRLPLVDRRSRQ